MRVLFGGVILTLLAAPAHAQAPPDVHASAPVSVAVTVYRDDLALITETRRVTLPGGPARVVFDGVLDRALPQSAVIRGLEGAERERNFDFDGLNPMSLLWRSIGAVVRVARTNPGTGAATEEEATVAAAGDGVMLKFADRTEALGCSGLPEKLVFSRIPEGLAAKPALSTVLADAPAGVREVTLSYLATGLEWSTDYVVTLNADATRARIDAWITLQNAGEEGFADARVGAVAGELSRTWSSAARASVARYASRACWDMGTTTDFPYPVPPPPPPPPPPAPAMAMESIIVTGAKLDARMQDAAIAVTQEELGDYQLYALNERTGLAAQQTKQVMFLQKSDVAIARVLNWRIGRDLLYDTAGDGPDFEPATIFLRAQNRKEDGLGEPMPEGTARVFAPFADYGTLYAGDGEARDTPVGVEWEVQVGSTDDVTMQQTLVSRTERELSGDRRRVRAQVSLELANATDAPKAVEVAQDPLGASMRFGDPRLDGERAKPGVKYGLKTWSFTMPPHARRTLTYTVSWTE